MSPTTPHSQKQGKEEKEEKSMLDSDLLSREQDPWALEEPGMCP